MTTATHPPRRGALIAIEGLDRAGKSTQCQLLLDRLQREGHNAVLQKFPDRTTPIGTMIDSYLRSGSDLEDHAIHLLFSANRWELANKIQTLLSTGYTVLLDRYIHSGIVFTTAAKSLLLPWCRSPEIGLPQPDLVLFLDISEEDAAFRGGYGEERYEKREIQDRVRMVFGEVRKEEEGLVNWKVVDAGRGVEQVAGEVWKIVSEVVEGERGELRKYMVGS
ncbi:thymidylate kinase-domain-containing protein [Tirmania nivea]|nr:thymidylate kinase-domain-containing protein [Tirmania nivea]